MWNCYTPLCPGGSLLPAKHGSAMPIASLLRQWVFCYFLPLKDFKSHFPQSYGGAKPGKLWVKEIPFLSLVLEWLCNSCCSSVGFLDGLC